MGTSYLYWILLNIPSFAVPAKLGKTPCTVHSDAATWRWNMKCLPSQNNACNDQFTIYKRVIYTIFFTASSWRNEEELNFFDDLNSIGVDLNRKLIKTKLNENFSVYNYIISALFRNPGIDGNVMPFRDKHRLITMFCIQVSLQKSYLQRWAS